MNSILSVLTLTAVGSGGEWKRHLSVEEEFGTSKYVFVGEVLRARQAVDPYRLIRGTSYTVRVKEPLKGNPPSQVEVYDENSSGRFPIRVGAKYLLFAYEGVFEGVKRPQLAIDSCGNSGTLKAAKKALATARKFRQTRAQPKD